MRKPFILFRSDQTKETDAERKVAEGYFPVVGLRSDVPAGSLVIGRYSVLPCCAYGGVPLYRELELDLAHNGSRLVNSYPQHKWIADFDYYDDVKEFTARSWREREFPNMDYKGPFVVKGATNSKKSRWKTHMYAADRRTATNIAAELAQDGLIGPQGIVYREFLPLKTFELEPISDIPYTNEWRLFYYKEWLLSRGYYWSSAPEHVIDQAEMTKDGLLFADKVAKIAAKHTNFYVLDIAQKKDGSWVLIEINDGQMSGLSENKPTTLYAKLAEAVNYDLASTKR